VGMLSDTQLELTIVFANVELAQMMLCTLWNWAIVIKRSYAALIDCFPPNARRHLQKQIVSVRIVYSMVKCDGKNQQTPMVRRSLRMKARKESFPSLMAKTTSSKRTMMLD
jgi:hypothetical protein